MCVVKDDMQLSWLVSNSCPPSWTDDDKEERVDDAAEENKDGGIMVAHASGGSALDLPEAGAFVAIAFSKLDVMAAVVL